MDTPPLTRRALLGAALAAPWTARAQTSGVHPRPLVFPADFGAHPETRTEWWYLTGALQAGASVHGFQVTFFRSRTGVAPTHPSRFAASQLVFAHAAVTDMTRRRLRHDQRIARQGLGIAEAATGDTDVRLRDWRLWREGPPERSVYHAQAASDSGGFGLELACVTTQPLLLQGEAGYSRKGPRPDEASHYYSQPQLAVSGSLRLDGRAQPVSGRAWLDHEWSDSLLDPQAVGWDWIGMNLDDGGALTAFRLRRADGSTLWAGGSHRGAGKATRDFGPQEVQFTPGRAWHSAVSRAAYPVQWTIDTPAGRFGINALLDDQELDSRASTGSVYWEGLSDLLDERGRRIGRGYLEMTGYAGRLAL
ncbi:MAG TPA: carotenoid 1,2-hydratase [Albitalea sp.]|nr:carotenoid 1,2-hydratase [Albitalea sp.]